MAARCPEGYSSLAIVADTSMLTYGYPVKTLPCCSAFDWVIQLYMCTCAEQLLPTVVRVAHGLLACCFRSFPGLVHVSGRMKPARPSGPESSNISPGGLVSKSRQAGRRNDGFKYCNGYKDVVVDDSGKVFKFAYSCKKNGVKKRTL